MLGTFQKSEIRIEVSATANQIRDSLIQPHQMQKWLWTQRFQPQIPEKLTTGLTFTTWLGMIAIEHHVQLATDNCLRLLLSQGIDGYHEWYWGDDWVQSRIEGITLLPLNLGQTMSLLSLRQFLQGYQQKD